MAASTAVLVFESVWESPTNRLLSFDIRFIF
jgi:hypothetical protein